MERAPKRLKDTPSALIFIILVLLSSQRLYSTDWTTGLGTALLLAFLGALLGLLLGGSRFKPWLAVLLAGFYSLFVIPIVCLWVLYKDVSWTERLLSLVGQLTVSATQLVTAQPVEDSTLFVVFAGVVYWFIGLTGGYLLNRRGNFTAAAIPAGIVLILIQLFDMHSDQQLYSLALYALLAMFLLGRLVYKRNRQEWKEKRVWISAESITDLNIIFGAAALALILVTWVTPISARPVTAARVAWEKVTKSWRDRQEELNKTIKSLHSNQTTEGFYGDSLELGTRAATGDDTTLRVLAPLFTSAQRYYWRVRTYDSFQNDQWSSEDTFDEPFRPADGSLAVADPQGSSGEFVFTVPGENLDVIVTPTRPIWISRAARVTFMPTAQGRIDPLLFTVNQTVMAGGQYTVHANIFNPTIYDLRSAGSEYPAWVAQHYLQLPADLPPEITNLARQITQGMSNPYDKAQAITDYLRKNITYSLTVDPTPPGQDELAWFLFQSKKGFCNYYASAEVVLLRSVGVPARMAVGFAQGEFSSPNLYTVQRKDAHAWPEVYFPGSGWVEFEPTVSQEALVRPSGGPNERLTPTVNPQETPGTQSPDATPVPLPEGGGSVAGIGQKSLTRLIITFIALVVLIIAGVSAYTFGAFDKLIDALRKRFKKPAAIVLKDELQGLGLTPPEWLVRWAYLAGLSPVERSFATVYRSLRSLGEKAAPSKTPAEAATALEQKMPESTADIRLLLEQTERSLYSQSQADRAQAQAASERIWKRAWRAALRRRWRALIRRQKTVVSEQQAEVSGQ